LLERWLALVRTHRTEARRSASGSLKSPLVARAPRRRRLFAACRPRMPSVLQQTPGLAAQRFTMTPNTTPHTDAHDVPTPAEAPGARAGGRERWAS
jgi:hypothetical protein